MEHRLYINKRLLLKIDLFNNCGPDAGEIVKCKIVFLFDDYIRTKKNVHKTIINIPKVSNGFHFTVCLRKSRFTGMLKKRSSLIFYQLCGVAHCAMSSLPAECRIGTKCASSRPD